MPFARQSDNVTLKELSLEELWKLFPIALVDYDPNWKQWFKDESSLLTSLIPEATRVSHIGSTAISSIKAKPIVDILVELPMESDLHSIALRLEQNGYIVMNNNGNRVSLNKGYTPRGYAERVFHIHLRYDGDNDELLFRDYLLEHEFVAREYEQLKLKLLNEHGRDRDAYTQAKTSFVQRCVANAKR